MVREKVDKSRITVTFQHFAAPESQEVGSLKRRVQSHLARKDEKLHAVLARRRFPSQNAKKTHQVRTTFGNSNVEKFQTVLA